MPKSNNTLRSQIKKLEFEIHKDEIPEHLKKDKRKELKECYKEMAKHKKERELGKVDKKYKFIKMMELKKVQRQIGKLEKKIKQSASPDSPETLQDVQELKVLKQNLLYVQNFPTGEAYLSLFGKNNEKNLERQEQIKKKILEDIENGVIVPKKTKKEREEDEIVHDDPQMHKTEEMPNTLEEDSFFITDETDKPKDETTPKPKPQKSPKPPKPAKQEKPKKKRVAAEPEEKVSIIEEKTPWNKEVKPVKKKKDIMERYKAPEQTKPKQHVKFDE